MQKSQAEPQYSSGSPGGWERLAGLVRFLSLRMPLWRECGESKCHEEEYPAFHGEPPAGMVHTHP